MVKGSIVGEPTNSFSPANLIWIDEKSNQTQYLTQSGMFAWSKSPRIAGFRCMGCGIIELHLQPEDFKREANAKVE
jgi:hypothetical protein